MIFEEPDGATPLDPDEIAGLKFGHVATRGELDELEQANITQGLQWLGRRRGGDILTDEFVRRLHKRLFGEVWEWAGTYRLREKNIGIDPFQISVQLRVLLDDARYWAGNGTYAPLEAAARFHHRMVQIHPLPSFATLAIATMQLSLTGPSRQHAAFFDWPRPIERVLATSLGGATN
ncbi:mobile mystery protein B [Maritalea sp.]|uniref:mobile mystery protein B n=1 Tax=Maritalea sp. TaxID=2003361 RepID=UPI003EF0BAFE